MTQIEGLFIIKLLIEARISGKVALVLTLDLSFLRGILVLCRKEATRIILLAGLKKRNKRTILILERICRSRTKVKLKNKGEDQATLKLIGVHTSEKAHKQGTWNI